jgi:hypothetical protein
VEPQSENEKLEGSFVQKSEKREVEWMELQASGLWQELESHKALKYTLSTQIHIKH